MTKAIEKEPIFWSHTSNRDNSFRWFSYWRGRDFFSIEVFKNSPGWHLSFDLFDEGKDVLLGIAGFGYSLYLSTGKFFPKWLSERKYKKPENYKWTDAEYLSEPRILKTGISLIGIEGFDILDDWFINFELLHADDFYGGHSKNKGISFNAYLPEWIFGKRQQKRNESPVHEAVVKLEECDYPVEVKVAEVTLSRPRFWKTKTFLSASVDIPEGGTPIPTGQFKYGGPNDRYGSSFPLGDPDKAEHLDKPIDWLVQLAIQKFKSDILKDRERYGYQSS